jgi:UDP-N-acetylmuramate dehydrogenase
MQMILPTLEIQEEYPLRELTTFKIGGPAKYFIEIHSVRELLQALGFREKTGLKLFVLGGGSNVLVNDRGFDGIVFHLNIKGIEVVEEDAQSVVVKVAAGESWDALVAKAVDSGWWGIENLSYIPGNVGALAIQNVGAYGQEASKVIEHLEVYTVATGEQVILTNQECCFGYRTSVFNAGMKGSYIIVNTFLRLRKNGDPNLSYRDLQKYFGGTKTPTLAELRAAVINLRQAKLPDPQHLGNAGSFFKNLYLSEQEFERLCVHMKNSFGEESVANVSVFRQTPGRHFPKIKVSTAFLIDMCGLKGSQIGGAALYHKHSLILVNATRCATAHEVMSLVKKIRQTVYRQTGLEITPEPTLVGFNNQELQEYFCLTGEFGVPASGGKTR